MDFYGDFDTFIHDIGEDRIFQMLVFKKIFTPYEQDRKFINESKYTSDSYRDIKIREIIMLPNDILLGIQELYDDYEELEEENYTIEYYKLSDIELSYNKNREKYYLGEDFK